MTNYEKRDRYAELNETLRKALEQEFYYEAIFIEHAILEDRVISLFKHANLDMPFQLGAKLEKLKTNQIFKDEYISKHIDMELLYNPLKSDEWEQPQSLIVIPKSIEGVAMPNSDNILIVLSYIPSA